MTDFKLQTSSGTKIVNPNSLNIREQIQNLNGKDYFIILSKSKYEFIQTSGNSKQGFILEYQTVTNNFRTLFQTKLSTISQDKIVSSFISYLNNDFSILENFEWKIIDENTIKQITQTPKIEDKIQFQFANFFIKISFIVSAIGFVYGVYILKFTDFDYNDEILGISLLDYAIIVFILLNIGTSNDFKKWNSLDWYAKFYSGGSLLFTGFLIIVKLIKIF